MKSILLIFSLFGLLFAYGQGTPINCGAFSSVGTVNPYGSGYTDACCGAGVPGTVSGPGVWSGASCSGYITSTSNVGPVTCMVVSYGAVNTNDYATISTDTGGNLTLTGVNMAVNGNVIGPYNCCGQSYGNVLLTVCSDIPFNSITLTNTGCTSGWVVNCASQTSCQTSGCAVPCLITNMTANISACNAGAYTTSGIVEFTDPPSSGQLIVEDCNGVQQSFNAPFTSPINYNLTGQNPNGLPCDVHAYFTADPLCEQTINYTAPTCLCNIDNFVVNIGACNPFTDLYMLDGTVEFTNPPNNGQLVIEVNNGTTTYDTIINFPFTSPQNWSISGIPSDAANSSVTVYFTSNPGCNSTINYTAPSGCLCEAEAGTYNDNVTGSTNNPYELCFGDQVDILANGDYTPPQDFNIGGVVYDPGIWLLEYSCPPTVLPPGDVNTDPCFVGIASTGNGGWSIPNNIGDGSTVYYVPVTMYSMVDGIYAIAINGGEWCYDLGPTYEVLYIPQITSSYTEDCLAGTATATISGGLPSVNGSSFTASNLQPGSASFGNTTANNGGTITINGLQGGDNWSFDIVDNDGCPHTVTGGPFPGLENPGFNYPQSSWCTAEAAVNPTITGVPGGTFTSTPAGLSINAATGQITPGTSTPGTYDITYTTPGACFDDSTITVSIAATPTVDPIADQTVCNGANFTAITITGSAGSTFNWTNDNTGVGLASIGTGNIAAFTGTAGGTQEVANVTVTPSAGTCVGTPTSFVLTVDPTEDPSFTYPAAAWCTSEAVQAATVNGTTGGTFSATPAGLTLNTATGDITPATSTPGTYDVTYTTPGPCTATSTVTVTINEVPVVDPVLDQTVCVGSNFTAVNFTSTTAGTSFNWTNDNVFTGLAANGSGNIAAFAGQTNGGTIASNVTVTPSTVNCTGNPLTFTLTVNDLDDATFDYTPGLTYCQTATDPVVNITGLAGGTFSYATVSGGPTLSLNTGTGSVTLLTSDIGNYDITYNTTGAVGSLCPNTLTLQLVITPAPTADFTLDVYCANDADPLPTYQNGGSGGTFSATPAGLSINPNSGLVNLGASTPGTYSVTNNINVAGCPTATYSDDITIFGLPDATISGTQTVCAGDPIADGVVTLTAGSNTPSWSLNYSFNGTPQGPVVINNPATTYNINPTNVGTYTINSVTDGNGCSNFVQGSITINNFPVPNMNVLNNQDVCDGDNLTIQSFGSDIPATYAWTNITGTDVGFGLNGNGDIGSFTGVNPGATSIPVTVEVTPTSLDGCVGPTASFVVTVHPRPTVLFDPGMNGCEPLSDTLINLTNIAGQTCEWDFGDGTSAFGCDTVYHTYMAGTYDVSLTVTTIYGCTSSYSINSYITVNEMPEASFVYMPQEINVDNTIVEFTNTSNNATSYLWDFGDGSSTSNQEHVPHMYPQVPDEYTVTLWAYNGVCEDMYQQVLEVKDVIIFYVPNVFTPDGDQFNEMFQPIFTSGFDPFDFHLTIFNRWGEIIFESYNAEKGWNGHYGDGGLVQDGVYIWQIEFRESMSDKHHTHRGHVTVLK